MKTIVLFLLFFVVFPILIATIRFLRLLLSGPKDDSLYAHQMYAENRKRSIIELTIAYLLFVIVVACLIGLLIISEDPN